MMDILENNKVPIDAKCLRANMPAYVNKSKKRAKSATFFGKSFNRENKKTKQEI